MDQKNNSFNTKGEYLVTNILGLRLLFNSEEDSGMDEAYDFSLRHILT